MLEGGRRQSVLESRGRRHRGGLGAERGPEQGLGAGRGSYQGCMWQSVLKYTKQNGVVALVRVYSSTLVLRQQVQYTRMRIHRDYQGCMNGSA